MKCEGRQEPDQEGLVDRGFYSGSVETTGRILLPNDFGPLYICKKITKEQIVGKSEERRALLPFC